MDDHDAENAAYFEGRDDGRAEAAEELLAAMSPDVRRLVEYDARFRLTSVLRQAAAQESNKRYVQSIFALQVQALATLKTVDATRPEWGSW